VKKILSTIRSVAWVVLIIGVFLLLTGQAIGPGLFIVIVIYFTLDTLSRWFVKSSKRELRIEQHQCPDCSHDLSQIGAGQSTCPNCGETIPATLRKWSSR